MKLELDGDDQVHRALRKVTPSAPTGLENRRGDTHPLANTPELVQMKGYG